MQVEDSVVGAAVGWNADSTALKEFVKFIQDLLGLAILLQINQFNCGLNLFSGLL